MEPTFRSGSYPMGSGASAVSINIFEPKAYSGMAPEQTQQPQCPQCTNPYYAYPNAPIYAYPQVPGYEPQGAPMPPQQQYPIPQQPQAYPQPYFPQQPVMQPMPPQQYPMPPAMPMPPVNQPPAVPVAPPPPSIIDQTPVNPVQVPPQAPQQPAQAPAQQPIVDVQGINNALVSPNLDEQTSAIQKIAEVGQTNPEQGAALINEQTFRGLSDIITRDTAQMQGADKEKAETNKMIGMWTLAVLQKNFRDIMDIEAQKQNVPPLPVTEIPGIRQIVNNVKADTNPLIREAGISALTYIAKPDDYQVLSTVFDIAAKQDADPNVKNAAQQALANLPKPAQQPAQGQPAQAGAKAA